MIDPVVNMNAVQKMCNASDDNRAFEMLFNHFHPRLVRFLSKRLEVTHVDPEDVAQEAMIKAWQKREQFNPRFQFSTWVYTIARRTAIDHLRRPVHDQGSVHLEDVWKTNELPDQRMEKSEAKQAIWGTAQKVLNTQQFSVLWLRYQEQMSVKEVAKTLSITGVSVRVLLHRARAVLKSNLAEHVDGDSPFQTPSSGDCQL